MAIVDILMWLVPTVTFFVLLIVWKKCQTSDKGKICRQDVFKLIAEQKGIPLDEVTNDTTIGESLDHDLACCLTFATGCQIYLSRNTTVSDLCGQLGL